MISQPLRPLLLRCRFIRAGLVVGGLELEAASRTAKLVQPTARTGHAAIAGSAITITSEHHLNGARVPTDSPVGYRFADSGSGEDIGAVDLAGFSRRAIAIPAIGAARLVSLAASIALAAFWDPGIPTTDPERDHRKVGLAIWLTGGSCRPRRRHVMHCGVRQFSLPCSGVL